MSRGVLLFAFDVHDVSYFNMAVHAAKRARHFLDLPSTLITDKNSLPKDHDDIFEHIIIVDPDKSNKKDRKVWINKGRSQAYTLSPYDETLLLDVDYIINSDRLNNVFEFGTDFCCHDQTSFLLWPDSGSEMLSDQSYSTLWATVVYFAKSKRAKQIFECMKMIEDHYHYYSMLHGFLSKPYRNDFALTLALRIANGHLDDKSMFIPWALLHTDKNTNVYSSCTSDTNTKFTVELVKNHTGKMKKEYISVQDCDFHVMNKACLKGLLP